MVDISLRCKHLNICLILNNCKRTFICDEFTSRLTTEKLRLMFATKHIEINVVIK